MKPNSRATYSWASVRFHFYLSGRTRQGCTGLPGGCPLLNTAVDSDNGNPVLRDRVRKALRNWQAMLRAILEDGIQAGAIRADVNAQAAANHIIGGLEGAMLISRIERNDSALRESLKHLDAYVDSELRQPPR